MSGDTWLLLFALVFVTLGDVVMCVRFKRRLYELEVRVTRLVMLQALRAMPRADAEERLVDSLMAKALAGNARRKVDLS